jgi:hypothetical protein
MDRLTLSVAQADRLLLVRRTNWRHLGRTERDCDLAANGWSWRDIDVLAKVPLPQGERQSRVFYMIDDIPPASQCQGFAGPSRASATVCRQGSSIIRPHNRQHWHNRSSLNGLTAEN